MNILVLWIGCVCDRVEGALYIRYFFFFKHKTAYERRISDWSSGVCSSDRLESERGAHRRFAEAQRELLDRLSAAVAQFGPDQGLVFANLPFRRLFDVDADDVAEGRPLGRLLDAWRERGRTPEVRDYPELRQAHVDWFALPQANEEEWLLRDGTHLRVVAQPTPDGGLLLNAEDRTEQVERKSGREGRRG